MSLPPSVGTVRIGGTIVHPNTGTPIRAGRVEVDYPYEVRATTDGVLVIPGTVAAPIIDGAFLTPPLLDPHDPDITPQGYPYTVRIISDQYSPPARVLEIPQGSANQTLDLANLGEATSPPQLLTYALVSQLAQYVAKGTLTAKGALLVATAAGVVGQLTAGGNGLVLTTDASTPTGLKWAAGGGGGGGIVTVNGQTGPDVELDPADVGAATEDHDHGTADILGLAAYVDARAATLIAALVDTAPGTLDTLNELAAALGDDPNFAATITGLLGGKQPLDTDLTDFAALTPANNDLVQRIGGAWTSRTPAQVKTSLALTKTDVGLGNVTNTAPADLPISTATQAALDLKLAAAAADVELYAPAAAGLLDWTADPQLCSVDFQHSSGALLMMRFRYRGAASVITEIGLAVSSSASAPGAYSGVALYEDGTGVVNRLGQSADAGAQWTSPGVKSVALTAPVPVVRGNYYRAALLWNGGGNGRIAGAPLVILPALMNAGTRRSTFIAGQSAFPATIDVAAMTLNNATYWIGIK